jgi:hypothetical protein
MSSSDARILPYCEPSSKDEFYAYAGVVGNTYAPYKESKQYSASVKALLDTLLKDANTPFAAFDGVIKALTEVNNQMLAELKKVDEATKTKSKAPRLNLRDGGADVDDQEAESDEEAGDKGGEILDEQKLEELAKQEQAEKEKELKVAAAIRKKNEEDERRRQENEELLQAKMRKEIDNDISKNAEFAPLKRDDEDEFGAWSAPKGKGKGKGKK